MLHDILIHNLLLFLSCSAACLSNPSAQIVKKRFAQRTHAVEYALQKLKLEGGIQINGYPFHPN
jgi:hypothetical protein